MRSAAARVAHGIEAVLGLYVLSTIASLDRPWVMARIDLGSCGPLTCVRIAPPLGSSVFVMPAAFFVGVTALLFAGSLWADPRLRALLRHLGRTPARRARCAAALLLLCASLWPLGLGTAIALYLWLGTLGVTWTVAGAIGCCQPGGVPARVGGRMLARAATAFLAIPPAVLVGAVFVLELGAMSVASATVFDRIPHVSDSITQLFHARIFAAGGLTAAAPEPGDFFAQTHMILRERWYSQYPPGHILPLSLGVIAGVPWLVNPLLGATTVALLYPLARELYDEATARLALVLGALSPFVLFMSSEYMNHATALFTVVLGILCFARALRTERAVDGAAAGLCFGWLAVTRPLSAVGLLAPFALYALWALWRAPGRRARSLLAMLGAALAVIGLLLVFNHGTTGSALRFGYNELPGNKLGFGFDPAEGDVAHTPARALGNALKNLNALNKYLFEWPIPALTFVAALFASRRAGRWDALLLSSLVVLAAVFGLYRFQDLCFGPRYLYEAAAGLIVLSARGIRELPALLRDDGDPAHARTTYAATACVLLVCTAVAGAGNLPALIARYGDDYWGVGSQVLRRVEAAQLGNAIVFTREDYGGVFPQNDPDLAGPVIYARDLGARNWDLAARHPGRSYFVADRHCITPLAKPAADDR